MDRIMDDNVDSTDKAFFADSFNKIDKRLEKIEDHQQKTCDELDEVDKNVIKLQTSFNDHREYTKREEDKQLAKKLNVPQWVLVIVGIGTLGVGIAMSMMALT